MLAGIAGVVYVLLTIYLIVLWARFVIDLLLALRRGWRPPAALAVLFEIVYTLTDPPVRWARRLIPPMRLGGASVDFSMLVVLIACSFALNIAAAFM